MYIYVNDGMTSIVYINISVVLIFTQLWCRSYITLTVMYFLISYYQQTHDLECDSFIRSIASNKSACIVDLVNSRWKAKISVESKCVIKGFQEVEQLVECTLGNLKFLGSTPCCTKGLSRENPGLQVEYAMFPLLSASPLRQCNKSFCALHGCCN